MIKYDISAGELLKIFDKDYEPKNAKKAIKQRQRSVSNRSIS